MFTTRQNKAANHQSSSVLDVWLTSTFTRNRSNNRPGMIPTRFGKDQTHFMGFRKICHQNAAVFKTPTVAPLKMQTVEMREKQIINVKAGFKILQYYILAVLPIKPDVNHEKTTVSCLPV